MLGLKLVLSHLQALVAFVKLCFFFGWDIVYSGAYIVYCMLVYYFSVQSRTIYTFGARSFAPAVETSKITFYLPVSSLHHMKDENFRLVSPIDSDMNMHNHKVDPLPAISRGGVIAFNFFFRGYKPSYPSIRPFEGLVTYNPPCRSVDSSTFSGPNSMGGYQVWLLGTRTRSSSQFHPKWQSHMLGWNSWKVKNISIATWLKLKGCLLMVGICTRKDKQIPIVLSSNSHEYCRLFLPSESGRIGFIDWNSVLITNTNEFAPIKLNAEDPCLEAKDQPRQRNITTELIRGELHINPPVNWNCL